GLFRAVVGTDGVPVREDALLYDQAFVLLAMAASARVRPDLAGALTARAVQLVNAIERVFGEDAGGFHAAEGGGARRADPVMHLFEAVLAWAEVDPGSPWPRLANAIGGFFLERLFDGDRGTIREAFGTGWTSAPEADSPGIEPGHQYEWAWLLSRWRAGEGSSAAMAAARRLFEGGERGVDPATGLVLDLVGADYAPLKTTSRLWPQTERLKAWLVFDPPGPGPADGASAIQALAATERFLTTRIPGLWRDRPGAAWRDEGETVLASSFYHLAGAALACRDFVQPSEAP
ncbi:MAG: AGE family epimerase/isomerase, partial [Caulobacteraceae bacterium]|nr:AGE family epimerase/isomerase [Caulobacteraceae bacterium]